jgi:hypothetical protein
MDFERPQHKASLTPEERIRAAYAHLILGVDQHTVAAIMGVNPGRVNEAVSSIRTAAQDPKSKSAKIVGIK